MIQYSPKRQAALAFLGEVTSAEDVDDINANVFGGSLDAHFVQGKSDLSEHIDIMLKVHDKYLTENEKEIVQNKIDKLNDRPVSRSSTPAGTPRSGVFFSASPVPSEGRGESPVAGSSGSSSPVQNKPG